MLLLFKFHYILSSFFLVCLYDGLVGQPKNVKSIIIVIIIMIIIYIIFYVFELITGHDLFDLILEMFVFLNFVILIFLLLSIKLP